MIVRFQFLDRGGLTQIKLMPLTDEILSRQPYVVYIEIGSNELCGVAQFVLADEMFTSHTYNRAHTTALLLTGGL